MIQSVSAGALGAFSDTDRIDSVFIQPASNNQFICEACTLCLPRSELLEHRSAKYHLANVHRLRDNPAFDMSEIAAAKGARVEALAEQLGRKAAGNATSVDSRRQPSAARPVWFRAEPVCSSDLFIFESQTFSTSFFNHSVAHAW